MKKILCSICLAMSLAAGAAPALHVGDRVEADMPWAGKGTVLELGHGVPYEGYYKIHFDKFHHAHPKDGEWVNPKEHTIKHLGADDTPMAAPQADARPPSAPPVRPEPVKDTDAPGSPEANFKQLIRERYPAVNGVTKDVEFHTFQVSGPVAYEDVYSNTTRGHIYQARPVKTTYKVTEHYQGEDIVWEYNGRCMCFKNVHGEWTAVQQGEMKITKTGYFKR